MKLRSKISIYAMTGALSLGIFGGTTTPTLAATNQKETVNVDKYKNLDAKTQLKVDEILNTLRKEIANLGVSLSSKHNGKGDKFVNLDDETKTQVQGIMKQVKEGSLTQEEATTKLKDLGVTLPTHNGKGDKFANLDDETKTKVQEIMKQRRDGSLTQEEADKQLKDLGVTLPIHNEKGGRFANLDDETKKEATKLIENAKKQMEELGVDFPTEKFNFFQ